MSEKSGNFGRLNNAEEAANSEDRLRTLLGAPLDRWIALSEDESRVVADGASFEEAAAKAEKNGVSDPILVKTPGDWTPRVL